MATQQQQQEWQSQPNQQPQYYVSSAPAIRTSKAETPSGGENNVGADVDSDERMFERQMATEMREEEAARDAAQTAYGREKQAMWEQVISYATIAFAISNLKVVDEGTTFFQVLAMFFIAFVVTARLKAYGEALLTTRRKAAAWSGLGLLSTLTRLSTVVLAYITFLLVQIVMGRATPHLSDGRWRIDNLLLPIVFLGLVYSEWRFSDARNTPDQITAD